MIHDDLLALLCCPLTHQPLRTAPPEVLARLELDAALLREDGRVAYPVRNGIPLLLPDAGIALEPPPP